MDMKLAWVMCCHQSCLCDRKQPGNRLRMNVGKGEAMSDQNSDNNVASRRQLLKLGALAAPAVITLNSAPAMAQAVSSTLMCEVPFPERGQERLCRDGATCYPGGYVDGQGYVCGQDAEFKPSTHGGGSIDYAGQTFNGNQIVNQLAPNRFSNPQKAYYNYVKKLQQGEYGYSCFTSLNNQGLLP